MLHLKSSSIYSHDAHMYLGSKAVHMAMPVFGNSDIYVYSILQHIPARWPWIKKEFDLL